jgi:Clp amino terminal domain, pathogenicity island component
VFERFTDRARRVVVLAQEEARLLNHNDIGTEHILLGLIHEGEGVAAKALESLGLSLVTVRRRVEEIIGRGGSSPAGEIPFTPRAKKVLELAQRESLQLGHDYIGTEHILLGLIREAEGVAAQVLVGLGADLSHVRLRVIQLLSRSAMPVAPSLADPTLERLRVQHGALTLVTDPSREDLPVQHTAPTLVRCALCNRSHLRLVTGPTGAAVCELCVIGARQLFRSRADEGADEPAPQLWLLDPNTRRLVAGLSDDQASADAAEIAEVIDRVDELSADGADAVRIENGTGLGSHVREAAAAGLDRTRGARFEAVRIEFLTPRLAHVRIQVVRADSSAELGGRLVKPADTWLVTRRTLVALLATVGVIVSPEPPT